MMDREMKRCTDCQISKRHLETIVTAVNKVTSKYIVDQMYITHAMVRYAIATLKTLML